MGTTKFKYLPEKIGLGATKSYFPFYDNEKDADFRVRLDILVDLIASQVVSAEKAVFELSGITNSGNNYSSTYALATYVTEGIYIFQPNIDSSGDSTLNIPSTGSGSLPIKKFDGTSLVNVDDLKLVNTYLLINKTTYWLLAGGLAGGSGSGTSLTDTITAGENLVENDLVYLKSDGKYWKADYLTVATCSTELRLVTDATILANATGSSLAIGLQSGFTGLTAGELYYVGAGGAICLYADIPDTEGIIVRSVGTAKSSTELEFNPDETYIETTLVATPIFDPLMDDIGDITPINSAIVDNDTINDFASKTQGQINALSLAAGGINRTVVTTASNVTAGSTAKTDYVYFLTGSNTLTLPTAVGNINKYLIIRQSGSVVSIASTSSQTFNGVAGPINLNVDKIQIELISDDSNWTY